MPLTFSYGHLLKKYALMSEAQYQAMRDEMRANYATPYGQANAGKDGAEKEGVVVTDEGVVGRWR